MLDDVSLVQPTSSTLSPPATLPPLPAPSSLIQWMARWSDVSIFSTISVFFLYIATSATVAHAHLLLPPPCHTSEPSQKVAIFFSFSELCVALLPSHPSFDPVDALFDCSPDVRPLSFWLDGRKLGRLQRSLLISAALVGSNAVLLLLYRLVRGCQRWWVFGLTAFLSLQSLVPLLSVCYEVLTLPSTTRPLSELNGCRRDPLHGAPLHGARLLPHWSADVWWVYCLLTLYALLVGPCRALLDCCFYLLLYGQRLLAEREARDKGDAHHLLLLARDEWQAEGAGDPAEPPGLHHVHEVVELYRRREVSRQPVGMAGSMGAPLLPQQSGLVQSSSRGEVEEEEHKST